jgi:hypothetical protein
VCARMTRRWGDIKMRVLRKMMSEKRKNYFVREPWRQTH